MSEDTKLALFASHEDAADEDEDLPMQELGVAAAVSSDKLIDQIISPSPFPQHNAGPTSARFRNALSRITENPTTDAEAWQALMTEASASYRSIPNLHSHDADTHAKLDWVESCYGMLLRYFPFATNYLVSIVEILLAQSARVGEPQGPLRDFGIDTSSRAMRCEAKIERIFQETLGVVFSPTDGPDLQNQSSSAVASAISESLGGMCSWVVQLWLLYIRKVTRDATRKAAGMPPDDRAKHVREETKNAYERAINSAGFSYSNHLLWKQYLDFVKSWLPDPKQTTDHALAQQQQIQLRSVYQRLITHPMTGLDQLWQEYELYEKSQGEALAQALAAEFAPKYQHARSVYLERNRVYSEGELHLGRLATAPVTDSEEDYELKMEEEYKLLSTWKKRCSYERTNPERLNPAELAVRIRAAYKELVSVLTHHPECWHMWSMWELYGLESKRPESAIAILRLAQDNIPDCTLLAQAESDIIELHLNKADECLAVFERFIERSPNTLAFVLYERLVRRYKGINEARGVFANARRVLRDSDAKNVSAMDSQEKSGEEKGEAPLTFKKEDVDPVGSSVTNRLDPSVGLSKGKEENTPATEDVSSASKGRVTWHLYASHAAIEHRVNKKPAVAARIYELGLRKHASFLTKPPYVFRYASLLLELSDTMNLRALLSRAVAAAKADGKEDITAMLWDMSLAFEGLVSGDDPSSAESVFKIEQQRREALLGAEVEDVATGGFVGIGTTALVGSQKTTIADLLLRSEGYNTSSMIVNGMGRLVDVLEVSGVWGSGESELGSIRQKLKGQEKDEEISGGDSDITYHKRLKYHSRKAAGMSSEAQGDFGQKLSARERLQAGGQVGGQSAMTLAIQQMPEWIRSLLLLLPASKLRFSVVAKPAPHVTELALSTLRQNELPAERPADGSTNGKRKLDDDSDDEDKGTKGGGYGNAFRARQRARLS